MAKKKKAKRKTRSIIIGHLEKINSKVFDKYRKQISDIIRGNYGVYALYRRDKLYYIGLATDFKNRINQHLKDRHKGKWNYFSLYIIRKSDHIREVEALLLRIANPVGNYQRGKLKGSKNVGRELKRRMTEDFKNFVKETFGKSKLKEKKKAKKAKPKKAQPLRGYFSKGKRLYGMYKGVEHKAWVFQSGTIRYDGKLYSSPSAAGSVARGRATNGWYFWKTKGENGELIRLSTLRK